MPPAVCIVLYIGVIGLKRKIVKNHSMKNLTRNMSEALELPKEITLDLPLITVLGKEEISIENYKGMLEYSDEKVRINTSSGIIKLEGRGFYIRSITSECVIITGNIMKLEYLT